MRSYLVLAENGPLLVMTSNSCITGEALCEALRHKGITKFIAYEVPVARMHDFYGLGFEVIAGDIERGQDLRVLDFDGPHIFDRVPFADLGQAIHCER